ncbi:MAG: AmmeMemoRadiSam system protein B [Terriglobales bacterium]
METRYPAVAGRFYPRDPTTLRADVQSYLSPGESRMNEAKISCLGCIVPHAGYIYSGHVAGAVFSKINIPRNCFVIGPNHTGHGRPLSIMSEGSWETPLGAVSIASELANALKDAFSPLTENSEAHYAEHAIEVELPFLQLLQPNLAFVPIALGTGRFELLEGLGRALAQVIAAQTEPVLIVASSDMNHYESDEITRIKDFKAIERILSLDARGLFDVVKKENISMCGFGPVITMLSAAKQLGAASAELAEYATSGDVSGDREMVVGYAGVMVK